MGIKSLVNVNNTAELLGTDPGWRGGSGGEGGEGGEGGGGGAMFEIRWF